MTDEQRDLDEQRDQSEGAEPAGLVPASRPRRRRLRRLAVLVAALYVAWCAALYLGQDWLLFPADMAPEPLPLLYNAETSEIRLDLEGGGQAVAWFIPAPALAAGRTAPVVVFFHGNAEIIDHQHTVIEGYQRLGCSVLLPEYRGYGRSAGTPSQRAIVADAVRFYDELVGRSEVDTGRIVFHGRSLGGGPAAQLAAHRKPKALILESTFSSGASMAHKYFAPAFLSKHPFRTDRVLESLDTPTLIFHGSDDDIIPVSHGRKLRDLARRGTYIEYDCRHNDFPGEGNEEAYWKQIAEFLEQNGIIERIGG